MKDERRNQVVAQCRAVAHLATALAKVHSDYIDLMANTSHDSWVEMVGSRTAAFMENLGDMLNGMDAVTKEDDWLNPIFKEAQRLWPQDNGEDPL